MYTAYIMTIMKHSLCGINFESSSCLVNGGVCTAVGRWYNAVAISISIIDSSAIVIVINKIHT